MKSVLSRIFSGPKRKSTDDATSEAPAAQADQGDANRRRGTLYKTYTDYRRHKQNEVITQLVTCDINKWAHGPDGQIKARAVNLFILGRPPSSPEDNDISVLSRFLPAEIKRDHEARKQAIRRMTDIHRYFPDMYVQSLENANDKEDALDRIEQFFAHVDEYCSKSNIGALIFVRGHGSRHNDQGVAMYDLGTEQNPVRIDQRVITDGLRKLKEAGSTVYFVNEVCWGGNWMDHNDVNLVDAVIGSRTAACRNLMLPALTEMLHKKEGSSSGCQFTLEQMKTFAEEESTVSKHTKAQSMWDVNETGTVESTLSAAGQLCEVLVPFLGVKPVRIAVMRYTDNFIQGFKELLGRTPTLTEAVVSIWSAYQVMGIKAFHYLR